MKTKAVLNKWRLFIQWVLANTIGMMVSMFISAVLIFFFFYLYIQLAILAAPNRFFTPNGDYIFTSTAAILIIIVFSVIIAMFQWFVIRTQIDNATKWIWTSSLGLSVGLITAGIFNTSLPNFNKYLIGAIVGFAIGIAQGLVLSKNIKFSGLWVLTNIIDVLAVMQIIRDWSSFLGSADDQGLWFVFAFAFISFLLVIAAFLYSIISGIVLVWLLNQSVKELQTTNA